MPLLLLCPPRVGAAALVTSIDNVIDCEFDFFVVIIVNWTLLGIQLFSFLFFFFFFPFLFSYNMCQHLYEYPMILQPCSWRADGFAGRLPSAPFLEICVV